MNSPNNPVKRYDKANSFVEIRAKGGAREDALRRIRELRDRLDLNHPRDHRMKILQRAFADLLDEPRPEGVPRFELKQHVIEEIRRTADEHLPRYLFYRYRYDLFPRLQELDDYPPCVQIEPTSICNYRCVFCYQIDKVFTMRKNGHMGMMPLDLFKRVVDELEGQCEALTLASRGEPLLCPNIEGMLDYLRGKFLGLKINTNAWYLDERKAHAILQSGMNTLVFSADAAEEPLYSQLRVNGKLERVVNNIRLFQQIRGKHYPDSQLITRVSGVRFSDQQNLDAMEAFWGGLVDQVAFVDYNPWENSYDRPVNDITTPCSDLWRRTFVWFDGTINPCDVDYRSTLAVGNVKEHSLRDLWRGEKYTALREAHLNQRRGTISPCNRCTLV